MEINEKEPTYYYKTKKEVLFQRNNTSDKIEMSFIVRLENGASEPGQFEEESGKISLIMENGNWKINYATLFDSCKYTYTVGKES